MKKIITIISCMLSVSASAQAVDPHVTQRNIDQTICTKGYTKTIRPSLYKTNKIKRSMCAQEGIANCGDYVLDHIVPLEVGGSPIDPNNLQLQSKANSYFKDHEEHAANRAVCLGKLPLARAQRQFLRTK